MKNSFKGTNFLINIYKPLGMFRLPRQKTKKIMKHNKPTRQVSMRMFLTLVLIMMSSAFVMAQENYGFKVAGVDVTSDNYLDLSKISGVSGKVYFDPNTITLTLDNATIEANDCNAILNETCDNLLIKLLGTNTINVTNSAGIYTRESTVILGDGGAKLSVKSDLCAIALRWLSSRDQQIAGWRQRANGAYLQATTRQKRCSPSATLTLKPRALRAQSATSPV